MECRSLFLFSLDSQFRLWCAEKLMEKRYQRRVMIMIVFSCFTLALEGRGDKGTGQLQDAVELLRPWIGGSFFDYINFGVMLFFMWEGLLKVVTHGFIQTSGPTVPYLKKHMDQVDFFIILICAATYLPFDTFAGPWARALRITAVARLIGPLLDLTDDPQIALVLVSFGRSIGNVVLVMLPVMVIGLMFSVSFALARAAAATSASASPARCLVRRPPLPSNRPLCVLRLSAFPGSLASSRTAHH
jgi:hypothetical protein